MISQSISIYKESYLTPSPPTITGQASHRSHYPIIPSQKATKYNESVAARVGKGPKPPTEEEYTNAIKLWNSRNVKVVGQRMYIRYSPNQNPPIERIFTRILPLDESHVQWYGSKKEVQCIEMWSPEGDTFQRVSPDCCFCLNTKD